MSIPRRPEFERMWLVAGALVGRLLASPNTTRKLSKIENDNHRGHFASLLFWDCGISSHPAEK